MRHIQVKQSKHYPKEVCHSLNIPQHQLSTWKKVFTDHLTGYSAFNDDDFKTLKRINQLFNIEGYQIWRVKELLNEANLTEQYAESFNGA